ncbi:RICIN domain-containing protein [Streptomyces sp. NPDC052701]|uniref:RICIN domain-containing protein n=1 Tax=Streptomyces sp. NPDC052701 TaxID=3155533 RepID=UPI003417AAF3
MKDAGLSNSPDPARKFGTTDEQLSAELRKWTGATPALHPVGELLDRHWEAGFAYARLCTGSARSAGILTTAAFTRLFGETLRQTGPTAAWRPRLLVTVRRIAAEWDTDHRRELLHPDLRSDAAGGERPAARLLPPPDRRLLSGAFRRLPQSARCLLWHAEVETEPLAVPAGLLGLAEEGARAELGRARDRLREECLQLHRELAPDQECRRYLRLLDVTYRRGGAALDPDLRAHLEGCTHCRYGADQLDQFNRALGIALAEAVLGWGARDYVVSRVSRPSTAGTARAARPEEIIGEAFPGAAEGARAGAGGVPGEAFPDPVGTAAEPGRTAAGEPLPAAAPDPATSGAGRAGRAGTGSEPPAGARAVPRTPSRGAFRIPSRGASRRSAPGVTARGAMSRSALKAARRAARRRNLVLGILTVSGLVVLPLALWATGGSGDEAPPAEDGRAARTPGPGTGTPSEDPSWIGSGEAAQGALRGRLRNVASGLCVAPVGGKAAEGAETELTACSATAAQQWTYETDGLLRNAAEPGLCLDSRLGYSVRLAPCAGASRPDSGNVRYDLTLRGALVPRWDQDLALAPAATNGSGALVVKARTDDDIQRWTVEISKADLRMKVVRWDAGAASPARPPAPGSTAGPSKAPAPAAPAARRTTSPSPGVTGCSHGPHCSRDGEHGGRPGRGGGDRR